MSREGDLMRKALRKHLVPALVSQGFAGGPNHYLRFLDELQNLLSLQYWKHGGSFILEFGHRPRGPLQTSWGEVVPEEKLEVAYLPVSNRARLQDRLASEADTFAGFAFASFGEEAAKHHELAQKVAAPLSQVDAWLRTGQVGPDIRLLSKA